MIIKFNKNLYNLTALKKAVDDYNEFAKFVIESGGEYFIVKINEINQDVEAVFQDEFCNYVLGKMK